MAQATPHMHQNQHSQLHSNGPLLQIIHQLVIIIGQQTPISPCIPQCSIPKLLLILFKPLFQIQPPRAIHACLILPKKKADPTLQDFLDDIGFPNILDLLHQNQITTMRALKFCDAETLKSIGCNPHVAQVIMNKLKK